MLNTQISHKLIDDKWRKYALVNWTIIASDNGVSPVAPFTNMV